MENTTTPTVEDCKERFIALSSRYGYKKGWKYLQKEFDHDLLTQFACQARTVAPEGQRVSTPEGIKASSKWSSLFENTETP